MDKSSKCVCKNINEISSIISSLALVGRYTHAHTLPLEMTTFIHLSGL